MAIGLAAFSTACTQHPPPPPPGSEAWYRAVDAKVFGPR